jgi:hypothetical protein
MGIETSEYVFQLCFILQGVVGCNRSSFKKPRNLVANISEGDVSQTNPGNYTGYFQCDTISCNGTEWNETERNGTKRNDFVTCLSNYYRDTTILRNETIPFRFVPFRFVF